MTQNNDPNLAEVDPQIEAMIPTEDVEEESLEEAMAKLQKRPTKDLILAEAAAESGDPTEQAATIAKLLERLSKVESEQRRLERVDKQEEGGMSGMPFQYYKRPEAVMPDGRPDPMSGYVTFGPGGAGPSGRRNTGAYAGYLTKGLKPLTAYGVCPIPGTTGRQYSSEFFSMLMNGGAKEFPARQVIEYKWHVNPPRLPNGTRPTFPQYEEAKDRVLHFVCRDCDLQMWTMDDDTEKHNTCFRHLTKKHDDGSHGYKRDESAMIMSAQGFPAISEYAALAEAIAQAQVPKREE